VLQFIRKCAQIPNERRNKSRYGQCRQPDHSVLSCKATKQPLDTVPALWIELTVSADVVVDWGGGSSRVDELCMEGEGGKKERVHGLRYMFGLRLSVGASRVSRERRDGRFFARWTGYVADWLGWWWHSN